MDYCIAIPSYHREQTIQNKTLKVLESYNIDPAKIKIFVNDQEEGEYDRYANALKVNPYAKDIEIIRGVPTIGAQRNFIEKWYPEGTYLMMFDDDIEEVQVKISEQKLGRVEDLEKEIIQQGFSECEKVGAKTFGIYAAANAYFMKDRVYNDLCYIIASMFGVIVEHDDYLARITNHGEDYEYSLRQYVKNGVLVRLDNYTVKSRYYKEEGGLQDFRTKEYVHNSIQIIADTFPELCTMYIRETTGHAELKLHDRAKKYRKVESSLEDLF
jgi:hypothetical protein